MVQMGFLTADSTLTDDETGAMGFRHGLRIIRAPQPVTYTPDATSHHSRILRRSRRRSSGDQISAPATYAFTVRIMLASASVAAGLQATVPARAIIDDMDGVAEPITELGKLHHAWVRERGLPSALDHHDHP